MIEIDGVELRTAAQWEKKHRHVKKGQLGKGVERTWRSRTETRPRCSTTSSRRAPGRKRTSRRSTAAAAPTPRRSARPMSAGASRAPPARNSIAKTFSIVGGLTSTRKPCRRAGRDHTAYQWCDLGFVPIAEARWRLTRYGGNSAWYYCSPWDVRYDPDRAKELLETGPREYDRLPDGRPYDGRPWWQA